MCPGRFVAPGARLNFSLLQLYEDEEQRLARAPVEPHLPVFLGATPTPGENLFFCFGFFFPGELQAGGDWRRSFAPQLIFLVSSALPARAKPAGGMNSLQLCRCPCHQW